jgi:DNA repair exonuclease SbcCD ATPase subunit
VAELEAQMGELQAQLRAAQSDGANAREQLQVLQEAAAAAATRAIGAQEGAPSMAQVAGVNESNQPAIKEAISMQVDASKLASLTAEAARAAQLEAEIAELRREQDELLICIAEQDQVRSTSPPCRLIAG